MKRLIPLAMRRPTKNFVYGKSKYRPEKTITDAEFAGYGANEMLVSLEDDGVSNPQQVTAYGRGLDAWYLAEDVDNELGNMV